MEERIINFITEQLDKDCTLSKLADGTYVYEMNVPYDSRIDVETVTNILEAENPLDEFYYVLNDKFDDEFWDIRHEYEARIIKQLESLGGIFSDGISNEARTIITDYFDYMLEPNYSTERYLDQKYKVPIMIDTGDENYDYTLNSGYLSKNKKRLYLDNKASMVWLAKQQGYTKSQLLKAIRNSYDQSESPFLASVSEEYANMASQMNTVTFLVEMSLEHLIDLNGLIKLRDRNGYHYDATKNPYCGYIIIDKKTQTGLFDPWSGAGSILEIKLEKDVKLPVKFIRSALPDGGDGYGVDNVSSNFTQF